jgi:ADP-ribose pyrophosphatase
MTVTNRPSETQAESSEILYRGKFLELSREGRWEYVSRTTRRGAAFIVPITDTQEIVLVEQYRVPLKRRCIELPAGIIGDEPGHEHEPIEAAAARELEEETGFRPRHMNHVLTGPTAGGMTCELLHLLIATGLERIHAGGGVEGEEITVHVIPLATIDDWLDKQIAAGMMVEPRIYAGLRFAERMLARS